MGHSDLGDAWEGHRTQGHSWLRPVGGASWLRPGATGMATGGLPQNAAYQEGVKTSSPYWARAIWWACPQGRGPVSQVGKLRQRPHKEPVSAGAGGPWRRPLLPTPFPCRSHTFAGLSRQRRLPLRAGPEGRDAGWPPGQGPSAARRQDGAADPAVLPEAHARPAAENLGAAAPAAPGKSRGAPAAARRAGLVSGRFEETRDGLLDPDWVVFIEKLTR